MYKIFHGFHLVEAYQDLKKAKRLAKNQTVARCIKLTIAITLSLILWFLPIDTFGIEGLTVIEQRLISIFIFATLMWVFEAVPAWTTSVLIVVLLLLTVSDSSLWFLTQNTPAEELGQTVKYKSILHCRSYHHAVYRWIYSCHRSNQKWTGCIVGTSYAETFRNTITICAIGIHPRYSCLFHVS